MAHDAFERSLNGSECSQEGQRAAPEPAAAPSLGKQVQDLQDILSFLLNEIENTRLLALANQARLEQEGPAVRRLQHQVDEIGRAEEILRRAAGEGAPGHHRHAAPKPKRDRHGLRALPGGLAALVPAAFLAQDHSFPVAWGVWRAVRAVWRSHRHVMTAAVLLAAIGGTASGTIAANTWHPPARALVPAGSHARSRRQHRQPPPAAAPVAHPGRHCHDRDGDAVAVLMVDIKRCRDTDTAADATAARPATTAPPPSPQPSATPPATPTPSPSVSPLPTPTPTPTPSASSSGPAAMGPLSRRTAA